MGAWGGPFLIATVLLAAAGVAKCVDPRQTVGALRAMHLPAPPIVVRLGGALEAVLAVAAALTGAPALAALVALSYAAFTGFVVIARVRRLPIGTCGCFGKVDTPPSALHVAVNVGAAVAASAIAIGHGAGLGPFLSAQPWSGVPFLGLVAVGVYATFSLLTVVPQLELLRRSR